MARRAGFGFLLLALFLGILVLRGSSVTGAGQADPVLGAAAASSDEKMTGTVTDPDGNPLEAARIVVTPVGGNVWTKVTFTNAAGDYAVSWPCCGRRVTVDVWSLDATYQPYSNWETGVAPVLDIELKDYGSIVGTVVDDQGVPAVGIVVSPAGGGGGYPIPDDAVTDAAGRFSINRVVNGDWTLLFKDPSSELATTWLAGDPRQGGSYPIRVTDVPSAPVQQTLAVGHTISGTVRSTAGVAIGGSAVQLVTASRTLSTTTDTSGRFVFGGLSENQGTISGKAVSSESSVEIERVVGWVTGKVTDTNGDPYSRNCPIVVNFVETACASFGPNGAYVMALSPGISSIQLDDDFLNPQIVTVVENETTTGLDGVFSRRLIGTLPVGLQLVGASLDSDGATHLKSGAFEVVFNGCAGGGTGLLVFSGQASGITALLVEDSANLGTYRGFISTYEGYIS
ncbi:MAG: carboxypeptidase-like regulatory domain-containing protein [Acidimicrobiales bacterium]